MGNCLATPQVADNTGRRGWAANGVPLPSGAASAASAASAAPAHSSKAMSAPGSMGAAAAAAAGVPHAHLRGGAAVSLPPAIAAMAGSPGNSGVTPRADPVKLHQMKKRIAVAAEAITNAADIEVPVVPKTEFAERLIGEPAAQVVLGGGGHCSAMLPTHLLAHRLQLCSVQRCCQDAAPSRPGRLLAAGTLHAECPASLRARRRLPPAAKAIRGNLLFEQLSMPAKQAIIRSMTPQAVRAGDVIIRQVRPCWAAGCTAGRQRCV